MHQAHWPRLFYLNRRKWRRWKGEWSLYKCQCTIFHSLPIQILKGHQPSSTVFLLRILYVVKSFLFVDYFHKILVHGEKNEMSRLQQTLLNRYSDKKMEILTPRNCQTVRLQFRGQKKVKAVGKVATGTRVKLKYAVKILTILFRRPEARKKNIRVVD